MSKPKVAYLHSQTCRICAHVIAPFDEVTCEVCGVVAMHFACWLAQAATAAERRPFDRTNELTDHERQDITDTIVMRCLGCRS